MKTFFKFTVMMFVIVFASQANAATEIKTESGQKVSVGADGSVTVQPRSPVAKKATPAKKKKSPAKKKVKKVVSAAQVAPTSISPTASTDMVPSLLDITVDGKKYVGAISAGTSADLTKTAEVKAGWEWNAQKHKSEWVTRTAKAKSSSMKIELNLLGVFMPDKLSGTSRCDHLSVSGVMNNNTALKTENSVNGINTISEAGAANFNGALRAKLGPVALDWQPMEVKRTRNTSVKGAPIGQVDIFTGNKIVLEFYAFEKFLKAYDSAVTIGVGYEYSRVEGNLLIGFGKVANEGGGWSSVYRVTYWYNYNRFISAFIGWDKENIPLTNKFLAAGLDNTVSEGGPFAGLNIGLF